MALELKNGILISDYGFKLLQDKPDFIERVWKDPLNKENWFTKDSKMFSKIRDTDIYVEKLEIGEGMRNLKQYVSLEILITRKAYQHIRSAKAYFADQDRLLLEFIPFAFDGSDFTRYKHKLNGQSIDEYWDFCMMGYSTDLGINNRGDVVLIDTHIPINSCLNV